MISQALLPATIVFRSALYLKTLRLTATSLKRKFAIHSRDIAAEGTEVLF